MHSDAPELEVVKRMLSDARENQRQYLQAWKRWQQVYDGLNTPHSRRSDKQKNRLYVKHAYQQIETIKARLIEPEPEFNFEPVGLDNQSYARAAQALIRYQLYRDKFLDKQHAWAHDAMVPALAVAKVAWDSRTKVIGEGEFAEEIVTKSDPTVIRVPPEDFLWDPAATSIEDASYLIHDVYLTKSTLRRRERSGVYENVDELIDKKRRLIDEERSYSETDVEQKRRRMDRFLVSEIYHSDGSLTVVGEECVILRHVDSLYHHDMMPFAVTSTLPKPNSIVGTSELWSIEQIQDYIWAVENMRIDAAKLAVDPPFKYRRSMKNGSSFTIEAGGRIGVDSMDDVVQLAMNPNTVFGNEEIQIALGYMQQMTGANVYLSGAESPMQKINQTTATGINLIQQESNMRMAMKLMCMHGFYARIADLMMKMNQQFISDERVVRIIGSNERITVPAEAIAAGWDVMPKWSSIQVNREQRRQSALELLGALQAVVNIPMADARTVNLSSAVEKLVESHNDDAQKYLVPVENLVDAQMRAQPQQQQADPMQAMMGGLDASGAGQQPAFQ